MIRFAPGARRWLTLSVFLIAGLSGCMDVPTAPETNNGGGTVTAPPSAPEVLKIGAGGAVSWVPMPSAYQTAAVSGPDLGTVDNSGPGSINSGSGSSVTTTVRIDGSVGGKVVCGRFVATIPAGAFEGAGDITMTMRDASLMICDLEVSPASLNGFAVPVELSLRTDGTTTDLDSLEIYWWDPVAVKWTAMSAQKSMTMEPVALDPSFGATETVEGVRLLLNHFSRYAAGKAGW